MNSVVMQGKTLLSGGKTTITENIRNYYNDYNHIYNVPGDFDTLDDALSSVGSNLFSLIRFGGTYTSTLNNYACGIDGLGTATFSGGCSSSNGLFIFNSNITTSTTSLYWKCSLYNCKIKNITGLSYVNIVAINSEIENIHCTTDNSNFNIEMYNCSMINCSVKGTMNISTSGHCFLKVLRTYYNIGENGGPIIIGQESSGSNSVLIIDDFIIAGGGGQDGSGYGTNAGFLYIGMSMDSIIKASNITLGNGSNGRDGIYANNGDTVIQAARPGGNGGYIELSGSPDDTHCLELSNVLTGDGGRGGHGYIDKQAGGSGGRAGEIFGNLITTADVYYTSASFNSITFGNSGNNGVWSPSAYSGGGFGKCGEPSPFTRRAGDTTYLCNCTFSNITFGAAGTGGRVQGNTGSYSGNGQAADFFNLGGDGGDVHSDSYLTPGSGGQGWTGYGDDGSWIQC